MGETHNPGASQFETQAEQDERAAGPTGPANSRGEVPGANDSESDKFNQTPDANQEAVGQTIAGQTS